MEDGERVGILVDRLGLKGARLKEEQLGGLAVVFQSEFLDGTIILQIVQTCQAR